MSLPGFASQGVSVLSYVSPVDGFLQIFNTNPYFIGLMMLILNLGGRFISLEVTKKQEQFLQHPWIRRILIFTVLFVATRNIWVAFWLTIIVVLFLGYLFNENSTLCIFGSGGTDGSKCANIKPGDDLTPEEKEILQRLMGKQQKYHQTSPNNGDKTKKEDDEDDDALHTDIYAANLTLLRNPQ
jgi:hypothetical protein